MQQSLKALFLIAAPFVLPACSTNPVFDKFSPKDEGKRFETYLNEHPSTCYKIAASIKEEGEDEDKKVEKRRIHV